MKTIYQKIKIKRLKDLAIILHKDGKSTREIGILVGRSHNWVHLALKEAKLTKPYRDTEKWKKDYLKRFGVKYKKIQCSGYQDDIREVVRQRDRHKCQSCGIKWKVGTRKFDVHHLDEKMNGKSNTSGITMYDRKNLDKLLTLCHKCHCNI